MSNDHEERIRRAAILIASLDETLAEQMLASLPAGERAKIKAEIERLDDVDPEEQQDVLDEFRRAGRTAQSRQDAVEFTYSAPRPMTTPPDKAAEPQVNELAESEQLAAEATIIAELLVVEHPQTIAAALSRLKQEQAAAAFALLPASLQSEVLDRLANLQMVDEDAIEELEAQLKQRIEEGRARRERMAASIELARRMLDKTSPEQRETLMARISTPQKRSVKVPLKPSDVPPEVDDSLLSQPTAERNEQIVAAIQLAREAVEEDSIDAAFADAESSWEAWVEQPREEYQPAPALAEPELEDQSAELEKLTNAELLAALQVADEEIVQRALASSSEAFLNRVASRLPRRQAVRLRRLVRSIGPTRLIELREAQWQLLRLARVANQIAKHS